MTTRFLLAVVLATGLPASAWTQEDKGKKEDAAHEELRSLRKQMVDAVNKNDIDALLVHLDKHVVVTWGLSCRLRENAGRSSLAPAMPGST